MSVLQVIRVVGLRAANHLEMAAVRMQETPAAGGRRLDRDLALVNQAVVQAAQGDEIGEFGLSAVGPVLDVVRIDVALMSAAGETAAAVAGIERAADRRRNAARFAPDIERLALRILEYAQQARIACEAAHGLDGDGRSMFDLAAPGGAVVQCLSVHVNDNLVAVGGIRRSV